MATSDNGRKKQVKCRRGARLLSGEREEKKSYKKNLGRNG